MKNMATRRALARPARSTPDRQWLWRLVLGEVVIKPTLRWFWVLLRHWQDHVLT